MKKIICALIVALVDSVAHCGPIANLDYIHTLIADRWNITIPFNRNITNINAAANMKYLLTTIDVANEILNGEPTTNYGNGEFATLFAADTIAADTAVETLVQKNEKYKFTATIDLGLYDGGFIGDSPTEFGILLGAAGTFYVDWGDGTTETIEKNTTDSVLYTHDYGTNSGTYTVQIGGSSTDYSDDETVPAISFSQKIGSHAECSNAITAISGSLGAIFPTLPDGSQPRFCDSFSYALALEEIPSGLFDGIHGTAVSHMFSHTFADVSITSIPEKLFAGITGAAPYMFDSTFSHTQITSIPEKLFAGITGVAVGMFQHTFSGCWHLTQIPENLFAGIRGAPAEYMFYETFINCSSLTGPSAKIHGQYLYDIWPDATEDEVGGMYEGATGLDDYKYIPTAWGGLGQERPIEYKLSLTHQWPLWSHSDQLSFINPDALMYISAAGKFYIDWGDGTTEVIEKENTDELAIDHEYAQAGTYTVRIGGRATAYSDDPYTSTAILGGPVVEEPHRHRMGLLRVSGCLGCVFPTLADGSQPRFISTLESAENCVNTTLPDGFLVGIHGAPVSNMFMYTFTGWPLLNTIPDNLFAGLDTTAPAVEGMFTETFGWCTGLAGPSAKINGQYLYDIWPDATTDEVGGMYADCEALSDYDNIPDAWK